MHERGSEMNTIDLNATYWNVDIHAYSGAALLTARLASVQNRMQYGGIEVPLAIFTTVPLFAGVQLHTRTNNALSLFPSRIYITAMSLM